MSQELVDTIVDAMPILEDCIYIAENRIPFRGKTLIEWSADIVMKPLHDKMSYIEVQAYNYEFVRVNDLIMSNLAFAKSHLEMTTAQYNNALRLAQNRIIENINADKTKKMLGADALERFAALECVKQAMAMDLASLIYEYWKTHSDKMKLLDSRLQNINYMVRN